MQSLALTQIKLLGSRNLLKMDYRQEKEHSTINKKMGTWVLNLFIYGCVFFHFSGNKE